MCPTLPGKLTAIAINAVLRENDLLLTPNCGQCTSPVEFQERFRHTPVEMLPVTEAANRAYGLFAARPYKGQSQNGVLRRFENPALATR